MKTFTLFVLGSVTLVSLSAAALACTTTAIACSEISAPDKGNTLTITNLTSTTLTKGSWIYWKRTIGEDGMLKLVTDLPYKASTQVARPLATSTCSAYALRL